MRAFKKAGFSVVRESKHIVIQKGTQTTTIPRQDRIDAYTMGGIVRDAGFTEEEYSRLL